MAKPRPVPRGMFAPGGDIPPGMQQVGRPVVPLEWIKSHPATFPWSAEGVRSGVALPFVTDPVITLGPGYEGVIVHIAHTGKSLTQGANAGINWALLVNKAAVFRCIRVVNGTVQAGNFMDYLGSGDGMGNSWAEVAIWLEEGATVEYTYNNNGGNADPMGWEARGYWWPVSIREEWLARGWRK